MSNIAVETPLTKAPATLDVRPASRDNGVLSNLRIVYALGPGDAVHTARSWSQGGDVAAGMSVAYSDLFYDACRAHGMTALAISRNERVDHFQSPRLVVENIPRPWSHRGGICFHLSLVRYALKLFGYARRWKADAVVVDSGTTHWFALWPLALMGVHIVPCLMNTLWPKGHPPQRLVHRIIHWLDGQFWRRYVDAVVCISPECARQARQLAGREDLAVFEHRPQYRADIFREVPPPSRDGPLRVLFAGRVTAEKGVFDLLETAQRLQAERPGDFTFDICGDGPALEDLRARVQRERLDDVFTLHGQLDGPALRERYATAHVVVVPTRSNFNEGLAAVAAEAVLLGRPVIVSGVVPAGEVLGDAALAAATDDAGSFARLLTRLADDVSLYQHHRLACKAARAQFLDADRGLGQAIAAAVDRVAGGSGDLRAFS
jgi:glycogen synthase